MVTIDGVESPHTDSWDGLQPAEAERWARRLRATAHPCGCKSGAAASLFALVGWPVFFIVSGRFPHSILGALVAIVGYGAVVIAAGIAGKVAGIGVGRRRHRRLQRELRDRLALAADRER
jgi:hypothetical protein